MLNNEFSHLHAQSMRKSECPGKPASRLSSTSCAYKFSVGFQIFTGAAEKATPDITASQAYRLPPPFQRCLCCGYFLGVLQFKIYTAATKTFKTVQVLYFCYTFPFFIFIFFFM